MIRSSRTTFATSPGIRRRSDPPRPNDPGCDHALPRPRLRHEHRRVRGPRRGAYAIDFMNCAPDADLNSVGQANFDWVVENTAELLIEEVRKPFKFEPTGSWDREGGCSMPA